MTKTKTAKHGTPAKPFASRHTQAAPYIVEDQVRVRDLWRLRTQDALVIGPIYGRGTADLLSAAPDLLDVAKRLILLADETPAAMEGYVLRHAIQAARAAVLKAEGK